jgi:hypothetical protein
MLAQKLDRATSPTIKRALWERGELFWKLHPGQLRIELAYQGVISIASTKLFVGDCARQFGKSTWAATKCIEKALRKRNAKIRYATAFLTDLEQFIIPAFDFLLADIPEHLRPVWRAQKSEYYFPTTKARIRLVGLDRKPNGLRGNKLDLVVLDEAGYIARLGYIYRSVLIPAMTHVPDGRIIMISTQPENPDHDFVKFCDKAASGDAYVMLTIYDNPMLNAQQIDEIAVECGGYQSTAFRREYLCERVVEETRAIVPEFREERHVAFPVISPAHHYWHRCESLDSAGGKKHKTGALFAYYDFGRAKLVIENEFLIPGHETTTRRIAEEVVTAEEEVGYSIITRRVGDNNNPILLRDLGTEFNLHFMPTTKEELNAMVNKVRLWFLSDRIEIHPRCAKLIGALKAGIWNLQRTEFAESDAHGHFDLIAALVYLVRNVPEHDNPVPAFFGQNLSEVVFPGGLNKLSGNAAKIRDAFMGGGKR